MIPRAVLNTLLINQIIELNPLIPAVFGQHFRRGNLSALKGSKVKINPQTGSSQSVVKFPPVEDLLERWSPNKSQPTLSRVSGFSTHPRCVKTPRQPALKRWYTLEVRTLDHCKHSSCLFRKPFQLTRYTRAFDPGPWGCA